MIERVYNILPSAKIPGKKFLGFWYTSQIKLSPGDLVQIPLGNRKVLGVVLFEVLETPRNSLKEVSELLLPHFMNSERLALLTWFSEYFHTSQGLILHLFLTGYSKVTRTIKRKAVKRSTPEEMQKDLVLNKEQQSAVKRILESAHENNPKQFLLFGPTGSGKTEVYLQTTKEILTTKKQVLILVPEIALTPQTLARFTSRFGENVFIYHSKMTPAQKRAVMKASYEKDAAVIIGPRSALFLPYKKLGLIVFDEEHDASFQQLDQNPHFDARIVATQYAKLLKIPLIFGDATPEIELYHKTQQKNASIELVQLHKRISLSSQDIPFPEVSIVDLVKEIRSGNRSPFSQKLLQEIQYSLANNEQTFLFLNRRGLASSVVCISCSHVLACKNCSTPLVLHGDILLCHQCGYKKAMPDNCPHCHMATLKTRGIGTEKIASEIQRLFPKARVARMDTDTIRTQKQHHEMYQKVKNHEVDIIVGTQMIAQGLDIPHVQLVGVIQCDNALNLPDFHSEERVFQLLTQVAGRAGRVQKQGKVIIQTFFPLHPVFQSVKAHNFEKFYAAEIQERENLNNPPFSHIVVCIFQHKSAQTAEDEANFLTKILSQSSDIEILGSSPAFMSKRRNLFRWQVLIRAQNIEQVPFDMIPNTWDIYVDPQSLLL